MSETGRSVLVVEDDARTRGILAEALARAGYRVATAGDGAEALAVLAEDAVQPSVIVLDWMMPVMGGPELIERLAADATHGSTPVVVLSAVDRPVMTPGLQVAVMLSKPVRLRTLVEIVDRLSGLPWRPCPISTGQFPVITAPASESTTTPTLLMRPKR